MIYFDEDGVALMGSTGFIGSALAERDLAPGVYFFDSPSSNILFDENLDYCMEQTIFDFLKVLQYCRDNDKYLVYPSSSTVINKNTSYARGKAILEELHYAYKIPALGVRIAAGYGPGEAHKGRYASVVYQFCQQMKNGIRPVIYGDGTQTRDFIYIDDIADNIQEMAKDHLTGVLDLGTGINTSFNELVATINKVLGTEIEPVYIDRPKHYVQDTPVCAVPCKVTLEDGIRKILGL